MKNDYSGPRNKGSPRDKQSKNSFIEHLFVFGNWDKLDCNVLCFKHFYAMVMFPFA